MDWGTVGDAFKQLFMGVAPAAGSAVAQGLIGQMLPGQGSSTSFHGMDPRTSTGQKAEKSRLTQLKGAEGRLDQALAGEMDPRLEYNIRKDQRAASAATGGLETGGHAVREMNSLADERNKIIQRESALVNNLSQGYTPLSIQRSHTDAKPNLWGGILTEMAGAPLRKGFEGMVDNFATNPDTKKKKAAPSYDEGPGGAF